MNFVDDFKVKRQKQADADTARVNAQMQHESDILDMRDQEKFEQHLKDTSEHERLGLQYAYNSALQEQEQQWGTGRDKLRYMHDDELFERHQAGIMAEHHLAFLQQQQTLAQTQRFQAQQAERGYQEQENRDYRMEDINQRYLGQTENFQQQRDQTLFEQNQKRDAELYKQQAAAAQVAADAVLYREEAARRDREKELVQGEEWKRQDILRYHNEKKEEEIVKGYQEGKYALQKGAQEIMDNLDKSATAIADPTNNNISREDKLRLAADITRHIKELIVNCSRPLTMPEQMASRQKLEEDRIKSIVSRMPPKDQQKYGGFVQIDKNGEAYIMEPKAEKDDPNDMSIDANYWKAFSKTKSDKLIEKGLENPGKPVHVSDDEVHAEMKKRYGVLPKTMQQAAQQADQDAAAMPEGNVTNWQPPSQQQSPSPGPQPQGKQQPFPPGVPANSKWLDPDTIQFPDGTILKRKRR